MYHFYGCLMYIYIFVVLQSLNLIVVYVKWLTEFVIKKTEESLKIPKRQKEAIHRRRIDNTMTKKYQRGNKKPYIEEE